MKGIKGTKKGIKKAGTTVISATLLTAGAVGVAFAYQSGASFHPSGKKQDLKKNQVVFSKNKKMTGQNEKKKKDDSRFLRMIIRMVRVQKIRKMQIICFRMA